MIRFSQICKKYREGGSRSNSSSSMLRITKDINDLYLPENCKIEFPDSNDLFHFTLNILPVEGYYKGINVLFEFNISNNYPFDPPKVKCLTEIYHPNIDVNGNVCLNILREDWNPVLTISSISHGLHFLLLEPNAHDPLNKEAADQLLLNSQGFAAKAKKEPEGSMRLTRRPIHAEKNFS